MVIKNGGREALDNALGDEFATIFLLLGPSGSKAELVHKMMDDRSDAWDAHQHWFLLHDQSALHPDEKWFPTTHTSGYVVLHIGRKPKDVATSGPILNLLTKGVPDFLKVRDEFLKGEG